MIRPHLHQVLEELTNYYQLILFTASESSYADAILDKIGGDYFDARLYREHCVETHLECGGSTYLKDLRLIGNRSLKDIIIVDNAVLCFALQLDNGVPLLPFLTDP